MDCCSTSKDGVAALLRMNTFIEIQDYLIGVELALESSEQYYCFVADQVPLPCVDW